MTTFLYLFYGLAFIATGLILGLQARLPFAILPRRALALLSGFALIHGICEWITVLTAHANANALREGHIAVVALNAISFGLLMEFGVVLWSPLTRRPKAIRRVSTLLILAAVAVVVPLAATDGDARTAVIEALVRYVLATSSAFFAASGLLVSRRTAMPNVTERSRRLFLAASVAFIAYGVLAGLIVPPAPFFPASHINTVSFRSVTGLPVETLRTVCALTLGGTLGEIFVVEATRGRAELARLREEFVSVVAHDLRTPVTTIKLASELMAKQLPNDESGAALRRLSDKINTSTRRLDRMIADLLDASRIEARQLTLAAKPTDVRALILAVIDRSAAICAGHPVRSQMPDGLPLVTADADRVEQILTNLLSNAGKYASEESEILVGVVDRRRFLEISVSNAGPELDPKEAELIFSRFYRAAGATHRAPGLGIGLYISKGLVEAHGGRIWVESRGGRTTFRFTLPVESGTDVTVQEKPAVASAFQLGTESRS